MKNILPACIAVLFLAHCHPAEQINRAAQNTTPVAEGTITNLYDAFGRKPGLVKDFGFSCILKFQGKTILFDAGSNADFFRQNVETLGFDLRQVDIAIVSHAHMDHLNGMDYLLSINPNVKIYFPEDIFWGAPIPFDATGTEPAAKDSLPMEMRYFDGGPTKFQIKQSGRFWKANIEFVKENREIVPGIRLIATASPYMGYFSKYPAMNFVEGHFEDGHTGDNSLKLNNLPELSLALDTPDGEVLIAGCSHSTIQRIAEETRRFTRHDIALVYGGLHLLPYKRADILTLADYLKNEMKVSRIAPAHCSGHLAFKILSEKFGENYVYAGLGETISFR
jgi:7,8-dihydropterin-6-yl-methyl-4-(beta-D-ribofuranosyl)aminobenzene 5'-phosphate synthase